MLNKGNVVQFNENHKWCGSLGIIYEVKQCKDYIRYMVGVPVPMKGTAFIFATDKENVIEYIGEALLMIEVPDDKK